VFGDQPSYPIGYFFYSKRKEIKKKRNFLKNNLEVDQGGAKLTMVLWFSTTPWRRSCKLQISTKCMTSMNGKGLHF
jgi:hypothetical protein